MKSQLMFLTTILKHCSNGILPKKLPCIVKFRLHVTTAELDIARYKYQINTNNTQVEKHKLLEWEYFSFAISSLSSSNYFISSSIRLIKYTNPKAVRGIDEVLSGCFTDQVQLLTIRYHIYIKNFTCIF